MRPNPALRTVLSPLDVLPFPHPRVAPVGLPCPHCASPLTLHQLDIELADRLIGSCEACKRWYLVDLAADRDVGVLVGLPGDDAVRALSRENPDEGISLMGDEGDPGPVRKPGG